MKKRALSFGVPTTHNLIATLTDFNNPVAISDYDAFLFDPHALRSQAWTRAVFERRQRELRDLISVKGGVVVCYLRADRTVNVSELGWLSGYSLLDKTAPQALAFIRAAVRDGEGSQWKLLPTAKGAMSGYFRVLQDNLHFEAFLESPVEGTGGTVFAVNSVGYPVAIEFVAGGGRLCFVPSARDVPGDRVAAAIARTIDAHFGGPAEIDMPAWAKEVWVPGADTNDGRIEELEKTRVSIDAEICKLKDKRSELLNYRALLFGYGRTVLEPVVRQAFRQLGFTALEPEEYEGEWDVQLKEYPSGNTVIGEIEGSEGVIEVSKFRQLLNYFQAEVLEGRIHKGILIGNGYKSVELDAPERQDQFTEHVLRGARQFGFCLLPTTDLFKAVCAVLESPADEALKTEIRKSILSSVGVWTFAREIKPESSSGGSENESGPPAQRGNPSP